MQDPTKHDDESSALSAVAQAIADRAPVDWAAAMRAVAAEASPRVETMRLIAMVAAAYAAQRDKEEINAAQDAALQDATGTVTGPGVGSTAGEAERASHPAPVLFTWGALQVLEHIGDGRFGEVYRAFDPQLERDVALKLRRVDADQDARATERFVAEARKLARIDHPNVLIVHGVDIHDGRAGIWTELVNGKTLAQYVADNGPLGADEAARIGLDLCCALASLHGHDLVHRDLKPSNVMRKSGGQILLMDFGSAGESRPQRAPGDAVVFGTPLSTAPEVLAHGEAPRPVHDVYSLGVLLYWLVSGRYPVEARDYHELLAKHADGVHTPLVEVRPELPRAFVEVVERALERDPAQRFATIGQLHRSLAEAVAARHPLAPPLPIPAPGWRKWSVAAATVLAAVAVAWGIGPCGGLRAPLQVQATLYRDRNGESQALAEGGSVQPGDQLFMDIQGNRNMYVWVVDEDSKGDAYALYPLSSSGARELTGGRRHRLPGAVDGVEVNWQVSDTGGSETILVVAAKERVENVERIITSLPRPGEELPPDEMAAGPGDSLRGIGRVTPRRQAGAHAGVIAQLLQGKGLQDGQAGIWVWRLNLKNKGS